MKSSRRNRIGLNLSETVFILTQFGVLVHAAAFESLRRPSDPADVQLLLLLQRHHDLRLRGDGTFEERVFDERVQPEEEVVEEEDGDGKELSLTGDPEGDGSVAPFERRARKVKGDSKKILYLIQLGHMIGTDVDTKTHRLYVGKRRSSRPEQQQQQQQRQGPPPSAAAVDGRQRLGRAAAAAAAGTTLRRLDLEGPWRWAFLPRIRLLP